MSRKPLLALLALAALCPLAPADTLDETKLLASNGAAIDWFGNSVAASEDVVVVGAYADDIAGNLEEGSARVFRWNSTTWVEEQELTSSNGQAGDWFGKSVAIIDDVIVVGAFSDEVSGIAGAGSATVFRWDGASWVEEQELTASAGGINHSFGWSVSGSGDVIVVGALGDDSVGSQAEGSATVFRWNGLSWVEEQVLSASTGAAFDSFGWSVSVSDDVIVVGTPGDDLGGGVADNEGSASVFRWNGTSWIEEQELTSSNGVPGDAFGSSVSVSGDVLVVGARLDDIGANGNQGSATAFRWTGTSWVEQQELTSSDGGASDYFGTSVSVSEYVLVVGAPRHDVGSNGDQGSATLYRSNGTSWTEDQELTANDGWLGDWFGISVSVSGAVLAVGAERKDKLGPGGNSNQGAAYVYDLPPAPPPTWVYLGNGLAGTSGIPSLVGDGSLTGGSPVTLNLSGARVFAPSTLVLGLTNISAPFKGGTLVPMPDFLLPFFSNGLGEVDFSTPWPAGIPSALTFYLQFWVSDPAGPAGFAASNALSGTTP